MGVMVGGRYLAEDPEPGVDPDGGWERTKSTLRDWISPGGDHPPVAGRYHLFAAWNCPWAHRVLLVRATCALQDILPVSYAAPRRTDQGWVFDADYPDPLFRAHAVHQVYARQDPPYTGRITVPVLWDKVAGRIVSNESADIVRMLGAFGQGPNLYPDHLADRIDAWNADIYANLNNGVYRAGFARTQAAYEDAALGVFAMLGRIEDALGRTRYLCGDKVTEADLRLFPTLARFDVAYHTAFKCNLRRIVDYPNLWGYARDIYQMPGIADTVRFDIYKAGYFSPSPQRNPLGIVPIGPDVDWTLPHDRG